MASLNNPKTALPPAAAFDEGRDQLGATHLCGLDALGEDTGCRVLS